MRRVVCFVVLITVGFLCGGALRAQGPSKEELSQSGFYYHLSHDGDGVTSYVDFFFPSTFNFNKKYDFESLEFITYKNDRTMYRVPARPHLLLNKKGYRIGFTIPFDGINDCGLSFTYEEQEPKSKYPRLTLQRKLSQFERRKAPNQ